jgi:drug/metabolite transporter (DMT)-like permease
MPWLAVAFVAPVLWAVSTHIDKYLVERYFKEQSVAVLLLFTALIGIVLLPFIGFFNPNVTAMPLRAVIAISFTGVLYMTAMCFYLQALQSNEASVVAPFYQAAPLFT